MPRPCRLRPYVRQQARFLGLHLAAASGTLHGTVLLDVSALANYPYRLAEHSAPPRV